jgi:hypothetical protein
VAVAAVVGADAAGVGLAVALAFAAGATVNVAAGVDAACWTTAEDVGDGVVKATGVPVIVCPGEGEGPGVGV